MLTTCSPDERHPGPPGFRCAHPGYGSVLRAAYFSDELTAVNLVPSVGPMPWTMAMIAKAMPQAIRQYSIAVAPDSSRQEFCYHHSLPSRPYGFFRADTAAKTRPDWLRGG